ncbi:MAG: outer membrane lipoprotein-sorting protein [Fidelibacterota bacterium]|nr:MAG: outer membrane lipoprotein-sorting protein [Candidatus Neomarinimicrobiota bacterium]
MRNTTNHRRLVFCVSLMFFTGVILLRAQSPTGQEILDRVNAIQNPANSSGVMTQTIQTSSGQFRTFELESYSANKGEKSLMRYRRPASVKDQAFLMLNNADDIWTYFPRTKRVRKLASHAKKQKVQGGDFTYEDMGSGDAWKEEYVPSNLGEIDLLDERCWKLQMEGIPEKDPAYQKMIIMVRQKDYYPLQVDYFADEGDLMKSLYLEDIREVDGFPTAMRMVMRNHEDGTETWMEILSITYDWNPPAGFFSERNLKK